MSQRTTGSTTAALLRTWHDGAQDDDEVKVVPRTGPDGHTRTPQHQKEGQDPRGADLSVEQCLLFEVSPRIHLFRDHLEHDVQSKDLRMQTSVKDVHRSPRMTQVSSCVLFTARINLSKSFKISSAVALATTDVLDSSPTLSPAVRITTIIELVYHLAFRMAVHCRAIRRYWNHRSTREDTDEASLINPRPGSRGRCGPKSQSKGVPTKNIWLEERRAESCRCSFRWALWTSSRQPKMA